MSYTLPAKWKFFSANGNGNSVTFLTDASTTGEPQLAIISRVLPVWQRIASAMGWSVPSYRVRVQYGVLDANGNPIATRVGADLVFRWPHGHAVKGTDVVADLSAILGSAGFAAAVFGQQLLPVPPTV